MSIRKTLIKIASELDRNAYDNEQQVIQGAIMSILHSLGWKVYDADEVRREYSVHENKVDIALRSKDKSYVFIEAKAVGKITSQGERQIFSYAANEGVPILVLTDGREWNFYYMFIEGSQADRKLCTLFISNEKQSLDDCVKNLKTYLSRDNVVSGKASEHAKQFLQEKRSHEGRKQQEDIKNSFLESLVSMLEEKHTMLPTLAKKMEQGLGYRPNEDVIADLLAEQADLLSGRQGSKRISTAKARTYSQAPGKSLVARAPTRGKSGKSLTGKAIAGFVYNGKEYPAKSGRTTMLNTLALFHSEDPSFLERMSQEKPKVVNRKRRALFSPDVTEEDIKERSTEIPVNEGGWWLNTVHSNDSIGRVLKKACQVRGVNFGTDFEIIAEAKES